MGFYSAEQVALIKQKDVRIAPMVRLDFVGKTMRFWNGDTRVTAGGEVFQPARGMASISGLPAMQTTSSQKVTLTLHGIPDERVDVLAKALEETDLVQQQSAIIYLQLFDRDWQPVGGLMATFWGFMQPPEIKQSPLTLVEGYSQGISLDIEDAMFNRSRPPGGRYTDADQQQISAGDRMMEFVASLIEKTYTWPVV